MTNLLLKLFIKDYKNVSDPKVRENYGKLASVVGMVVNLLLSLSKILVGSLFGVLSVLADGLNNLTDLGSNAVTLISFIISGKPADKEHPFGHARMEYIASMIVSLLILLVAFELAKEAIGGIIAPSDFEFSYALIIVLACSIMAKLFMFFFYKKLASAINSDVLSATSSDSINDVFASAGVLVSAIVSRFVHFNLDPYISLLVALIIAKSGIDILRGTLDKLLGAAPSEELVKSIKDRVLSFDGVYGVHDLAVHNYGNNRYFASVHVEVDSETPILDSHELIDKIERDFEENTNVSLVIHLDPIELHDEETQRLLKLAEGIVSSISDRYLIHDFRIVKGKLCTNMIFDVAVPFGEKLTDKEIESEIKRKIRELDGNYYGIVKVEKQM